MENTEGEQLHVLHDGNPNSIRRCFNYQNSPLPYNPSLESAFSRLNLHSPSRFQSPTIGVSSSSIDQWHFPFLSQTQSQQTALVDGLSSLHRPASRSIAFNNGGVQQTAMPTESSYLFGNSMATECSYLSGKPMATECSYLSGNPMATASSYLSGNYGSLHQSLCSYLSGNPMATASSYLSGNYGSLHQSFWNGGQVGSTWDSYCPYHPHGKCCHQLLQARSSHHCHRQSATTTRGIGNLGLLMRDYLPIRPHTAKISSLSSVRGRVLDLVKDQHGCRFLQDMVDDVGVEAVGIVVSEAKDYACELMKDAYGNYLMQKLIEFGSEGQRTEILLAVTKNDYDLINICLEMHGTRAVQKLFEKLTNPQQIALAISALRLGTITLIKDTNGHHVIQRCFDYFSHEDNKQLIVAILDSCVDIAMHQTGCCVLQRCLAHAQGELKLHLLNEITANALLLSQDAYGNYAVQYVLELKIPHVTAHILRMLEGNYVSLSMQKFGSHVVERCLRESTEEESTLIIKELLESPNPLMLLQHSFGNFVIQSAYEASKGHVRAAIVDLVRRHLPALRSHLYGKKIVEKINSRKRL